MSTDEILAQCILFFIVGYETTATTITMVCYYLAVNQDKQEKVRQEITTVLEKLKADHQKENPDSDEVLNDPYRLVTIDSLSQFEYISAVINETLRLAFFLLTSNHMNTSFVRRLCPPAGMTERRVGRDYRLETSDGKVRIDLKKDD